MQPVPHPRVAPPRGRRPARRALLATGVVALAAVAAIAGGRAGSGHDGAAPILAGSGVPLQRASCANWAGAPDSERARILGMLESSVGAPTEFGAVGTTLTRQAATELLDTRCAQGFAHDFLLYETYIRAAGYARMTGRAAQP